MPVELTMAEGAVDPLDPALAKVYASRVYVDAQVAALENKLRGTLIATMAATMLPNILAIYSPGPEGTGPMTEDEAIDMAFRLATKLSKRLGAEVGG